MASSCFCGHLDIVIDGFIPPASGVAPMFPFFENTAEWDDYGEIINPDDYIIKDEDMDQPSMQVSFHILYNTKYMHGMDDLEEDILIRTSMIAMMLKVLILILLLLLGSIFQDDSSTLSSCCTFRSC